MRFTAVITHCRLAKHGSKADITLESFREGIAENYGVFCTVWTPMTRSRTKFRQNISSTIYLSVTKLGRLQIHRNTKVFTRVHQEMSDVKIVAFQYPEVYSGEKFYFYVLFLQLSSCHNCLNPFQVLTDLP